MVDFAKHLKHPLTTRHPDGRTVLAKAVGPELLMVKYANRTQAERKAAELGIQWECHKGIGRPFYVALKLYAHLFGEVPHV
jgi:hypothetical protein